jgi:RimJ/RimL family protein N-acetyltransferase
MPIPSEPITTARLDLGPLRVEDAPEMVGVLGDPALYRFIGGGPPTLAELTRRYRAQVGGRSADGRERWHNWIVRERRGGVAMGFVQATVTDGAAPGAAPGDGDAADGAGPLEAEVAWLIGTPWQGRGYASEAAAALVAWLGAAGVGSIVAHVHPDHHGSAAVARRAGLEPTEVFVDGERAWRRSGPAIADASRMRGS